MDKLDREIQEAQRNARRRQMRGRFATIASVLTFLVVGTGGGILMFRLFPEPGAHKGHVRHTRGSGEPGEVSIENDDSGPGGRGRSRIRGKVVPVAGLAFASAYFVFKGLKPED